MPTITISDCSISQCASVTREASLRAIEMKCRHLLVGGGSDLDKLLQQNGSGNAYRHAEDALVLLIRHCVGCRVRIPEGSEWRGWEEEWW